MQNPRLDESQAGIKIVRRNINKFRYENDTILMSEFEEEVKNILKVKEESEKASLKFKNSKNLSSWHLASLLYGK